MSDKLPVLADPPIAVGDRVLVWEGLAPRFGEVTGIEGDTASVLRDDAVGKAYPLSECQRVR